MAPSISPVVRKIDWAPKAHSIFGAVGVEEEFDAGAFKGLPHACEIVSNRDARASLEICNRLPANGRRSGQVVLAPAEHSSGAPTLRGGQSWACIGMIDIIQNVN